MAHRRMGLAAIILVLACGTGAGWALEPMKEDLSACRLPHAELLIPFRGTFEAANGELVRLRDGADARLPAQGTDTPEQFAQRLRAAATADVAYGPDNGGSLWAISGRIADLGTTYLYEAAAMKLDPPLELPGTDKNAPGVYTNVQEGRTFLIETVDGHFALVHILEKSAVGLHVQVVYQPDGTTKFAVPQGQLLINPATVPLTEPAPLPPLKSTVIGAPAASRPASPAAIFTTPPAHSAPFTSVPPGDSGLTINIGNGTDVRRAGEPSMEDYQHLRTAMIDERMAIVRAPAATPAEIASKVRAIDDLVALHADEAADLFARQITFLDTRNASKLLTPDALHPCFAALKKMGTPATAAALRELRRMDAASTADGIEAPAYRAGLLGLVVYAVEGDDVAEFIMRRERDRATDPRRRALYENILNAR